MKEIVGDILRRYLVYERFIIKFLENYIGRNIYFFYFINKGSVDESKIVVV